MTRVITYGTYDLLHYGHINLLKRAKELGDYLIVGVTADDFDKRRGKINVQQSLTERIENVRKTGLADEIIVEEYEGQKIDDIKNYNVDIFTVGSDWEGKFDYLNEYCKVVYLPRTEGVSSSEIREHIRSVRVGVVGDSQFINKFVRESRYVNGMCISGIYTAKPEIVENKEVLLFGSYEALLEKSDAVYLRSEPSKHYIQIKEALSKGKHVLCESPVTLSRSETEELFSIAKEKKLVLMEAIKTAYATAFNRLLLLVKSGHIGEVVSIDATCTSLNDDNRTDWNGIYEWGPTALLPVFELLGTEYRKHDIVSRIIDGKDTFTKIDFVYDKAVASIKVGDGIKSEGELVISGTKGYIYVPAPWWKTDYFEIRYENQNNNKRYFYQLDGEGIRNEQLTFIRMINTDSQVNNISLNTVKCLSLIMEEFVDNSILIRI